MYLKVLHLKTNNASTNTGQKRKHGGIIVFCVFSHEKQQTFDCPAVVGLRRFPVGSLSSSLGVQ